MLICSFLSWNSFPQTDANVQPKKCLRLLMREEIKQSCTCYSFVIEEINQVLSAKSINVTLAHLKSWINYSVDSHV